MQVYHTFCLTLGLHSYLPFFHWTSDVACYLPAEFGSQNHQSLFNERLLLTWLATEKQYKFGKLTKAFRKNRGGEGNAFLAFHQMQDKEDTKKWGMEWTHKKTWHSCTFLKRVIWTPLEIPLEGKKVNFHYFRKLLNGCILRFKVKTIQTKCMQCSD